MTSKFCVIGSPIEHSFSPLIHRAAYSLLNLDYSFEKHLVSSGNLETFLLNSDHAGLSVTMPLKFEAAQGRVGQSSDVKTTLVANTLVREGSSWFAHNTDVFGFQKVFEEVPAPESVSIIGAGATARSACLAFSRLFPLSTITVIARDQPSVASLTSFCNGLGLATRAGAPDAVSLQGSDLVVSTVPRDGFPNLWSELARSSVLSEGVLFDVAYNPWPSVAASSWKGRSISGVELLIWQAIEQIRLFAKSQGDLITDDNHELYKWMRNAVENQNEPK